MEEIGFEKRNIEEIEVRTRNTEIEIEKRNIEER